MLCQGVPVRIELGPRDVNKGVMVMARRDMGAKITVKLSDAVESLKSLLEDIHEALFSKYVTPDYWQSLHSMWSRVYATVGRPSVCLSVPA